MLDEKSLRRPEFREGVPIVLGDGQAWTFPKPMLVLIPDEDGESFGPGRSTFDAAYDAKMEAFMASEDDTLNCLLRLAVDLFRRNYDVPKGAIATLFPYRVGDEANAEMWTAIRDVAWGRSPKHTAGGSAPS